MCAGGGGGGGGVVAVDYQQQSVSMFFFWMTGRAFFKSGESMTSESYRVLS